MIIVLRFDSGGFIVLYQVIVPFHVVEKVSLYDSGVIIAEPLNTHFPSRELLRMLSIYATTEVVNLSRFCLSEIVEKFIFPIHKASIAIIAITTRSSMRVNAFRVFFFIKN